MTDDNTTSNSDSTTPPKTRRSVLAALGALTLPTGRVLADGGTEVPAGGDWSLVFEDTFEGDSLNRDLWGIGFGWGRGTNASYEEITDDNVWVGDGKLHLTAKHNGGQGSVTAGSVHTKGKHAFGPGHYFEARLKCPNRHGWLPAFWAKSNDPTPNWPPEIDFFEMLGNNPNRSTHNIHYDPSGGMAGDHSQHDLAYNGLGKTTDFHTYGCAWFEDRIEMYVDGQHVGTHDDPTAMESMRTGAPFYMMLNIHVGKTGEPDYSEEWGEEMLVDHVRVYETPGDGTGNSYEHSLVIDGSGDPSSYEIDVGGEAAPSRLDGATYDRDEDSIDNGRISGVVGAGRDGYNFNGELQSVSVDGEATVRLDGSEIDPAQYGDTDTTDDAETFTDMATDYNKLNTDAEVIYEDNFRVRNSKFDIDPQKDQFNLIVGVTDPNGVGVIDSSFFRGGGIFTHPKYHRGTLIIKNCYIAESNNNGTYADTGTAAYPDDRSLGGTVKIDNCYYRDNNISHVRLNAGSEVRNTVIHNTGNVPKTFHGNHPNGVINSRGLHTFYGYEPSYGYDTVEAENIHVKLNRSNTNDAPDGSTAGAFVVSSQGKNAENPVWNVTDSEIVGSVQDNAKFNGTNVGQHPILEIPEGVPTSGQEALSAGADGSADLPGGPGPVKPSGGHDHTLAIHGTADVTDYHIEVSGDAEANTDIQGATFDPDDSVEDGVLTGTVAGGTDAYSFNGEIEVFRAGDGLGTVLVDGEEIAPADYPDSRDPEPETHTLVVRGSGEPAEYSFEVSGDTLTANTDVPGASFNDKDAISGAKATGKVIGAADAYDYTGDLVDLNVNGPATVTVDGEEVSPADYPADDSSGSREVAAITVTYTDGSEQTFGTGGE